MKKAGAKENILDITHLCQRMGGVGAPMQLQVQLAHPRAELGRVFLEQRKEVLRAAVFHLAAMWEKV